MGRPDTDHHDDHARLDTQRRTELGRFLRTRRTQFSNGAFEQPITGRKRTPGLRREEVAVLSHISVTWYTWLEQGRDIHPSRQVLDAVARTLHLSPIEHTYLLTLAGHTTPDTQPPGSTPGLPANVHHLLDALAGHPAYAITSTWDITGWNDAYTALYPNIATVPADQRNLLWLVFTDPAVRELLPDWETASRRFLAEFRAEAGPRLAEPAHATLLARLDAASTEFRNGWRDHAVDGFTSRERRFHHPLAGELRLEQHRLTPSDHPELHLMIYTPMPGTDTTARLQRLVTTRSTPPPERAPNHPATYHDPADTP
jgi:hypothetical protein